MHDAGARCDAQNTGDERGYGKQSTSVRWQLAPLPPLSCSPASTNGSFTATISTPGCAMAARSTSRPMRPKPLMPTRTAWPEEPPSTARAGGMVSLSTTYASTCRHEAGSKAGGWQGRAGAPAHPAGCRALAPTCQTWTQSLATSPACFQTDRHLDAPCRVLVPQNCTAEGEQPQLAAKSQPCC